jgi:putative ABC transport system permease protein
MSFAVLIGIALLALRRNVLRTSLTMLGLVIGVAAVIAITSLGLGAQAAIEDGVETAGTNLVIVIDGIAYLSPGVRTRQQLIAGNQNWSASVEGVGAELPLIREWPMLAGAFFTAADVQAIEKVCVIGTMIRDVLFGPGVNPVGRLIRIGHQPFRIVGVLAPKGQAAGGDDQDDAVFVPYTTAQKRLMGVTYLRNITISAASAERVPQVARDVRQVLRFEHQIGPGEPEDFRVRTLDEIVAVRTRATRTMTSLLAGIAAVSLLVGGVGVMNIMLVSVTERTREIGIRVAVGARRRDVLLQFLAEALILSVAGGLIGVAVGFLLAQGLSGVLGWPTLVTPESAVLAFAVATAIGIFFGWYPATKAASTDPIDALRFE